MNKWIIVDYKLGTSEGQVVLQRPTLEAARASVQDTYPQAIITSVRFEDGQDPQGSGTQESTRFSQLLGRIDDQLSQLDDVQERLARLQERVEEYEQLLQTLSFFRCRNEEKEEKDASL